MYIDILINVVWGLFVGQYGEHKAFAACIKLAWIFTQKAYRGDQSVFIGGRDLLRVCRARSPRIIALGDREANDISTIRLCRTVT